MTATYREAPERLSVRLAVAASHVRNDALLVVVDVALVAAAYLLVLIARFEAQVPTPWLADFAWFLPVAIVVHLLGFGLSGSYGAMWRHAGIAEARRLLAGGAGASGALAIAVLAGAVTSPLSLPVIGGALATGLVALQRFHARLFAWHRGGERDATRLLVVGAGSAAAGVVKEMVRDPELRLRPVAVLDDDSRLWGRQLAGVPIVGGVDALEEAARRHRASQVLLTVPETGREFVRHVAGLADNAGCTLKVLSRLDELVEGEPSVRDVRDIAIEDLLGRDPVAIDVETVRDAFAGKRIMVLGAGGSIGSEIARQLDQLGPADLVLLDNDETHLFDVAATVSAGAHQVLCDVRDADTLMARFAHYRPEVVFHAAAHKHVPLLEAHPCEAARTNVLGTANVVQAARRCDVERLVFVSTDKAVRPSSVMGASKRLGEQLVRSQRPDDSPWCAVRFGNVLGSRGSVVPTFMRQIRDGGPVTVTDPRMSRYFMSIPEAVELVLQAGAMAEGGEVFMLDMGEPVRILDLAERMIRLSGQEPGEVPIRIVGTRPGEKLAEELVEPEVTPSATSHPAIQALVPPLAATAHLEHLLHQLQLHTMARDEDAVAQTLLVSEGHRPPVVRLPDPVDPSARLSQEN